MESEDLEIIHENFEEIEQEKVNEGYFRRTVNGKNQMVCLVDIRPGWVTKSHKHGNDESMIILEGSTGCTVGDRECELKTGDIIYIPPNVEHKLVVGDKGVKMIKIFSPPREDYLDGTDSYLREPKA